MTRIHSFSRRLFAPAKVSALVLMLGWILLASYLSNASANGLNAVTDLSASASSNSVTLSWTDNSTGETGYKVERKIGAGSWKQILRGATANQNSFTNANLSPGAYSYRVRAYKANVANAPYSNIALATVSSAPAAPSDLSASYSDFYFSVEVTYQDNSDNAEFFTIQRRQGDGPWQNIGSAGPNESFFDGDVVGGQTYSYRVRAENSDGVSDFSNIDTATVPFDGPTLDSSFQNYNSNGISVGFDVTNGSSDFSLFYRLAGSDEWTRDDSASGDESQFFSSVVLSPNTQYEFYATITVNGPRGMSRESGPSNILSVLTNPAPTIELEAGTPSASGVNLSWTDAYATYEGFSSGQVFRSINGAPFQSLYGYSGSGGFTYFDSFDGIAPGSTLTYYVLNSPGVKSNEVTVVLPNDLSLKAATNLTATPANRSVTLNWTDNSTGESGYKIERKIGANGTWKQVYRGTIPDQNSFQAGSLTPNTTYFFRVRPFKANVANGPYSNVASATTPASASSSPSAPSS